MTVDEFALVGAGGYGREVLEYALDAHAAGWPHRVVAFFDDSPTARDGYGAEAPLLGGLDTISASPIRNFVIAMGAPDARRAASELVHRTGGHLLTLVHPRAHVAASAQIGPGTIVCPFALVGAHATVAENVSINVYGSIGHDADVARDCVVSPYVAVTGSATLGESCFLGAHATVAPGVVIGSHSKVSAGSVVTRDVPPGSMVAGSPARGRVMFKVPGVPEDRRGQ